MPSPPRPVQRPLSPRLGLHPPPLFLHREIQASKAPLDSWTQGVAADSVLGAETWGQAKGFLLSRRPATGVRLCPAQPIIPAPAPQKRHVSPWWHLSTRACRHTPFLPLDLVGGSSTPQICGNASFLFLLTSGCSWFQRRQKVRFHWAPDLTQPDSPAASFSELPGVLPGTRPHVMPAVTSRASLASRVWSGGRLGPEAVVSVMRRSALTGLFLLHRASFWELDGRRLQAEQQARAGCPPSHCSEGSTREPMGSLPSPPGCPRLAGKNGTDGQKVRVHHPWAGQQCPWNEHDPFQTLRSFRGWASGPIRPTAHTCGLGSPWSCLLNGHRTNRDLHEGRDICF